MMPASRGLMSVNNNRFLVYQGMLERWKPAAAQNPPMIRFILYLNRLS